MEDICKRSLQLSETMIRLWLIQEEMRMHQKFYEVKPVEERMMGYEPVFVRKTNNHEAN